MKIIIITQNEPFFLKDNLIYLFSILPKNVKIVGCVVSQVSPYGKKESFLKKCWKTLKIFGFSFFIYYSIRFVISKLSGSDIRGLLQKFSIKEIKLTSSINSDESLKKIKSYNPDLLVSILGNQIFKSPLINLAKLGCINLHTALLPKYRGLMPTFWVLKNNEIFTGVSVFFVDEGIDSGPIIVQKKVKINNLTQIQLIKKTKHLGMQAIAEAIDLIKTGNFKLIENSDNEKTYFSFPTRADVLVFKKLGKNFF